jgi:hypothetical protein
MAMPSLIEELERAFKAGFSCGQMTMATEDNPTGVTGVTYWPQRIPDNHAELAHVAWIEWVSGGALRAPINLDKPAF